jgi:uncharacterized protein YndB with AHSA1/START domain
VSERKVSVSRVINAPAQKIFDVLADPSMHPVIDGSGSVQASRGGNPERLSKGAKFGMNMKIGLPYRIRNTVVEFEDGKRIAWRHIGRHVWRYELEPAEGGTRVTETFDWSNAISPGFIERMGYPKKHPKGMATTLERLEAQVT